MTRIENPDSSPPQVREAMKALAANPEEFAKYLADVQHRLLGLTATLTALAHAAQVELRGTHVEGDRFFHARARALPVERQLKALVNSLNNAAAAAEKVAFQRRKHDEKVAALPGLRSAKALEKANKRRPSQAIPVNRTAGQVPPPAKSGYSDDPRSIHDLRDRRSA
ncbi:hypothetical protein ABT093_36890 [Kitasatospora sp. NPDC002551]|uniref:hypothetical protein n=1 Tax=Kitasatospora sp. NPDC002551 TaxID=3154539 RepID=UPI00331F4BC3